MKRLSGSIFLASLIQLQRPSDTFAMCVDFIHQFRSPNQHTDPIQHERHLDVPRYGGSTNGVPILAVLRSLVVSPSGATFGKLGKSRSPFLRDFETAKASPRRRLKDATIYPTTATVKDSGRDYIYFGINRRQLLSPTTLSLAEHVWERQW